MPVKTSSAKPLGNIRTENLASYVSNQLAGIEEQANSAVGLRKARDTSNKVLKGDLNAEKRKAKQEAEESSRALIEGLEKQALTVKPPLDVSSLSSQELKDHLETLQQDQARREAAARLLRSVADKIKEIKASAHLTDTGLTKHRTSVHKLRPSHASLMFPLSVILPPYSYFGNAFSYQQRAENERIKKVEKLVVKAEAREFKKGEVASFSTEVKSAETAYQTQWSDLKKSSGGNDKTEKDPVKGLKAELAENAKKLDFLEQQGQKIEGLLGKHGSLESKRASLAGRMERLKISHPVGQKTLAGAHEELEKLQKSVNDKIARHEKEKADLEKKLRGAEAVESKKQITALVNDFEKTNKSFQAGRIDRQEYTKQLKQHEENLIKAKDEASRIKSEDHDLKTGLKACDKALQGAQNDLKALELLAKRNPATAAVPQSPKIPATSTLRPSRSAPPPPAQGAAGLEAQLKAKIAQRQQKALSAIPGAHTTGATDRRMAEGESRRNPISQTAAAALGAAAGQGGRASPSVVPMSEQRAAQLRVEQQASAVS